MTELQREKFKALITPITMAIIEAAPAICFAKTEDAMSAAVARVIHLVTQAAPEITNCFNGADPFPETDPNQQELPLGSYI